MATYYWVGGNGNWDVAGHWATTSGGTAGASVPTAADDVFLNIQSSPATITSVGNCVCKSLTISPSINLITVTITTLSISGSLLIIPTISTSVVFNVTNLNFLGAGFSIDTVDVPNALSSSNITLAAGAVYILHSNIVAKSLTLDGRLDTNNRNITLNGGTTNALVSSSTGTFNAGTSLITITTAVAVSLNGSVNVSSATIEFNIPDQGTNFTQSNISSTLASLAINTVRVIGAGTNHYLAIFCNSDIGLIDMRKTNGNTVGFSGNNLTHKIHGIVSSTASASNMLVLKASSAIFPATVNIIPDYIYQDYVDLSASTLSFSGGKLYIGSNSTGTATNAVTGVLPDVYNKVIFLTTTASGQTWTVPADWNNAANKIEIIGAGGSGDTNLSFGVGGGGGAYASVTNITLTPAETINYKVNGNNTTVSTLFTSFGLSTIAGSISGTTLTVSTFTSGVPLRVGTFIAGASYGTRITSLGTGTGGVGTYTINNSQTVASITSTYLCAANDGTLGSPITGTPGVGGLAESSYGEVTYAGGSGAYALTNGAGGGGAAGPKGGGGNAVGYTAGSTNNGALAGPTNPDGTAGSTYTIWTATAGGTAGSGTGGASGDSTSLSGGAGGPRGGGGGGDFVSSGGGASGIIVISYVGSSSTPTNTSNSFFMF